MQTCFELAGVSGGSLDRCDSPDTDITWTDGAHLTYRSVGGWNWHLIFQRNLEAGATNVRLVLISPDFRNNEILDELRYEWKIVENHTLTARVRRRDEMDMLVGTVRARRDDDIFVGYTLGF